MASSHVTGRQKQELTFCGSALTVANLPTNSAQKNSHFSNSASGITSFVTAFYDVQEWQEATRKNRGRQIEMGCK